MFETDLDMTEDIVSAQINFTINLVIFRQKILRLSLENTYINVFVHKSKVVGIRVETMDVGVKENEIYEFANNTYGNLSQKMKSKTWFGYKDISVGQDKILYAKQKEFNGTIETLDISTEELIDFTVGEDVILAVN